jgi:hypothetical protein
MNLLRFRRQIETLLSDLLGTYILQNGYITPSVTAREGNEPLDPGISVSGLEVILEIGTSKRSRDCYENTAVYPTYIVRLVQWSEGNLTEAKGRIEAAYNVKGQDVPVPEDLGPSKQAFIEIKSSTPFASVPVIEAP